jgi:hypothetical protein
MAKVVETATVAKAAVKAEEMDEVREREEMGVVTEVAVRAGATAAARWRW